MRLKSLIVIVAVAFLQLYAAAQEFSFHLPASVGESAETVFVHSGIPPFIIQRRIHGESKGTGRMYVRDYTISPLGDSASMQSISDTSLQLNDNSIVDVNFDGYKDLMIDLDSEEPVNIGQSSSIYLFNPATRRFEYSETFSGFSELSVNPIDSTLRSQILFLGGTGEDYQIYKVKNNIPRLIQHEYRNGDNYTKEVLNNDEVAVAEQYLSSPASSGWMKLTHSIIIAGALRPVEEWVAQRLDDDPTLDQHKTGIVKELRWGKYLVRRQREFSYVSRPHNRLRTKIAVHEMKRGRWITMGK